MSNGVHYLALETGGTKLVAGIAGSDLRIEKTAVVKRASGDRASQSFKRVIAAAEELLVGCGDQNVQLKSIGFGFGGTVRRSTNSPHLCLHEEGWEEIDVVSELQSRFRVPVYVENDCKLAALAEAHFGAGVGAASVFYVTLGTGVGGGYVRNGQILPLGDYGEAEIGHVVVDPDGPECCCGGRGCVEALCSGPGLSRLCERLAREHTREWKASTLSAGASPGRVASKHIVEAWERGDLFAGRVIEYSMERLARAVAATVNLLVPERVVVGGGLGTSSFRLLELLRERTEPLVVHYFRRGFSIVPSGLRESVVTQGAAILAAQRAE